MAVAGLFGEQGFHSRSFRRAERDGCIRQGEMREPRAMETWRLLSFPGRAKAREFLPAVSLTERRPSNVDGELAEDLMQAGSPCRTRMCAWQS